MESRKYQRWTDEEDKVLLSQVSRSPENLQKACETAAKLLGRTKLACQFRLKHINRTIKRRWTAEEDRVLIDQVKRHANNLQDGFRETARLLNRTKDACRYRWYSSVMYSLEAGVCFSTVGYCTNNVNRKNVSKRTSDNTEKKSIRWWTSILKLLKLR